MFHLSTGPFRYLEDTLIRDVTVARATDKLAPILVLSPSGHLLTHLQRKLATSNEQRVTSGFLNIHFLTFYALAERLLADSDYTEQVVTEPAVYTELVRRILSGSGGEAVDQEIRKALRLEGKPLARGLAGALAETLKDLRDGGMRADYALQAAQEGHLGAEAPEAASTLALYARLVGLFERHTLRSSADLLRRAATRAPDHPWIKQQKAIYLYGFYDLTGVQLDLVNSLANHPNARLYFPYEEGNPAYAYAGKLLNDPAFTSKTVVRGKVVSDNVGTQESNATLPPYHPTTLPPTTDVWSCSGARDEVWLAAKEILRLTDEGMPFGEIAVIARNPGTYLPALREIFTAHQIPYVSSRQEPAGSHPFVKTVRARAQQTAGEEKGSLSWTTHIQWAQAILLEAFQTLGNPVQEEITLHDDMAESLEELKILDALGNTVSRDYFLDAWGDKLDRLELPGPSVRHEGVQVLEVQEARGLPFRVVFLLGMNEKVFPRLIREDPFLSDAARSALTQATGSRLGRKMDGYEEERLLFELMRQAASQHLYLLTQRSDEAGKALIPSVYLSELERQNANAKPHRLPRSIVEKFDKRTPLIWTAKELSFLLNRAGLIPQAEALYKAIGWDVPAYYRLLSTHRAIESFKPGQGAYDGKIEDLSLLKTALSRPFSPTSLEDLAECPFQYYASHVLKITPEEELAPQGEITPQALGKLFHKTLEIFYRSGMTGDLQQAVDACFAQLAEALSTVYPLVIKSCKDTIYKELSEFIKSDLEELKSSGFKPSQFEQPLEGSLPLANLPYRFFGKPDRLDVRESAGKRDVRVVDYKSGKNRAAFGRIETQIIQGKFLQLPIYLGLAGALEASLRPVRQAQEEGLEKTLTADFWQTPSAALFAENMKEIIKVAENGSFYIEPEDGEYGHCSRCPFPRVCRKEHMPSRLRAERDATRTRVSEKLARTAPKDEGKTAKGGGPEKRGNHNSGSTRKAGIGKYV